MVDWPARGGEGSEEEDKLSAVARDFCGSSGGTRCVKPYKLQPKRLRLRFLLDGGSTNHCVNDQRLVVSKTGERRRLAGIVGGNDVDVVHLKCMRLRQTSLLILGALYSPALSLNILSEGRLLSQGWRFAEDKTSMYHKDRPEESRTPIVHDGGLQWVDVWVPDFRAGAAAAQERGGGDSSLAGEKFFPTMEDSVGMGAKVQAKVLEHIRNGHFGLLDPGLCEACDRTKRQRARTRRKRRTDADEECLKGMVSCDLCGPLPLSISQKKYLMLFVVHDTGEVIPYFLSSKRASETRDALKQFCLLRGRPRLIRCDNGGEFAGAFADFCANSGIQLRNSPAWTPALNGEVEVMNRVIIQAAACNLYAASGGEGGAQIGHWPSAVAYVCATLSRLPRPSLGGRSSFFLRTGKQPDNSHLRAFWQRGHYLPLSPGRKPPSKLHPRRILCRLVGYTLSKRGYKVLDLDSQEIVQTLDVVWDKEHGPTTLRENPDGEVMDLDGLVAGAELSSMRSNGATAQSEAAEELRDIEDTMCEDRVYVAKDRAEAAELDAGRIDEDYIRRRECAYGAVLSVVRALADAKHRDKWTGAIAHECRSVDQSWVWATLPAGHRALPSRIICTFKEVEQRFKARLVVIGFLEYLRQGENVYAPTLMSDTLRAVLATAQALNEDIRAADISTAFLLAPIPDGEEIYVLPPKGWVPRTDEDAKELRAGRVWRLRRALYGLRRSPKWWADHFAATARSLWGLEQFPADRCIWILRDVNVQVYEEVVPEASVWQWSRNSIGSQDVVW